MDIQQNRSLRSPAQSQMYHFCVLYGLFLIAFIAQFKNVIHHVINNCVSSAYVDGFNLQLILSNECQSMC